jgi:L-lactate dehydrogenase complex protein LldG
VSRNDAVELFAKNLEAAGVRTACTPDQAGLPAIVEELIAGCRPVYCPGVTEMEAALHIPTDLTTTDYVNAAVSVEEMPAAIAETGTIISWSAGGAVTQTNLLPARHVALISAARIFRDLNEFFASFGGCLPSNVTLITGPSRTADIEQILITGVHGPERLDVVVVGYPESH